jgi:ribonuclease J
VLCSSTNIDSIAAFYHANPRGRYFLCDKYQKDVLDTVTALSAEKSAIYDFGHIVTYGRNIEDRFRNKGFCMMVRARTDHREIIERYPESERLIIYSMWTGYLSPEYENSSITDFLSGLEFIQLHTSGHADATTISNVIDTVKPKYIVPIHTEYAEWFDEHYSELTIDKYDSSLSL